MLDPRPSVTLCIYPGLDRPKENTGMYLLLEELYCFFSQSASFYCSFLNCPLKFGKEWVS